MTTNPDRRRMITIAVAVVLLAVFVALGMFVRVPYVALGPGPTVNTLGTVDTADGPQRVVRVEGAVDPEPKGHLNLTTVSLLDGLTLFQALGKWVSPSSELQPRESYYQPGQSEDEVRQQNLAAMSTSEDDATVAAFNYLKKPTAVGVADVVDDGPAARALAVGDRVTAIGGAPVATMEQMAAAVGHHQPGDTVDVEFVRGDEPQNATVTLAKRPDDPTKAYIGISMRSVPADPALDVTFDVGDIGGPSAGTMMTLSIIDQMTPGDLSHGEFVAGTGTIDAAGQVGEIGGINHKVRAAEEAGATVFLVPEGNCSLAASDAPDGIELVKVSTLSGAVDALKTLGTDAQRPHC